LLLRAGMMPLRMVSLPRNQLIALFVGVCVLSAAIGSGLALVAQEGPAGPAGKRGPAGPQGPEGPEGPSGAAEIGGLEAEVEDLRGKAEDAEELEGRIEDLESEVAGIEGFTPEQLCDEFELSC
jgi:hypothetical protein